jgi:hypothetical protein
VNSKLTSRERKHLLWVKEQACIVCGMSPPSDAHHVKQGLHYTCLPLCKDCHQGSRNGIHGEQLMWKVMKMDELIAIDKLVSQLVNK